MDEKAKIRAKILEINFLTLRYISLISLAFSVFVLYTDFYIPNLWDENYNDLYKLFDIPFFFISLLSFIYFWPKNDKLQKVRPLVVFIFPLLVLTWSSIIAGIEFEMHGLTTFVMVVFFISFFLYLDFLTIAFYLFVTMSVLIITIIISSNSNETILQILFLLVPTFVISIFICGRNYRNKVSDIKNIEKIQEINNSLLAQYSVKSWYKYLIINKIT